MNNRARQNEAKSSTSGGFTLVELLVAMGLGAMVASMMMFAGMSALEGMRSIRRFERLHANAIYLVDAYSYWVKQGQDIVVPDSETMEIILPDSTVRTFALDGTRVTMDGGALTSDDVSVEGMTVTKLARSVRIEFTMRDPNSGDSLPITTTVAKRNEP